MFFYRGNPCEPVFKQVAEQILNLKPPDSLLLTKAWKVKLVNEAADDAGGVFDEVVTHICMVSYVFLLKRFVCGKRLVSRQKL